MENRIIAVLTVIFAIIALIGISALLTGGAPIEQGSNNQRVQLLPYPQASQMITIESGKNYAVSVGKRLIITHISRISGNQRIYLAIDARTVFRGRLPKTGVLELPKMVVEGGSSVFLINGESDSPTLRIHGYIE